MMKLIRLCLLLLGIATLASASGLRGSAGDIDASEDEAEFYPEDFLDEEGRQLDAGHWGTINRKHGAYGGYKGNANNNWNAGYYNSNGQHGYYNNNGQHGYYNNNGQHGYYNNNGQHGYYNNKAQHNGNWGWNYNNGWNGNGWNGNGWNGNGNGNGWNNGCRVKGCKNGYAYRGNNGH
jgi:hypothetical protein